MVNFSIQHILIMRLIFQYTFPSTKDLHTLLYFASASKLEQHDLGFYDFIKTPGGVYSTRLQSILDESIKGSLIDLNTLKLTKNGLDAYYALARALLPFEDYWSRCVNIYNIYQEDFTQLKKALSADIRYRRAKNNTKLFN